MAKVSGKDGRVMLSDSFDTITNATGTDTIEVSCAGHSYLAGEVVWIFGVVGMTDINGEHLITSVGLGTFDIVIPTTAQTYTSGGSSVRVVTFTGWSLDLSAEVINTTEQLT